jgi:hypothetical protein
VTILDVRSREEVEGPDGHISGSRSALATQQLIKAGLSQVANLRGGPLIRRGPPAPRTPLPVLHRTCP